MNHPTVIVRRHSIAEVADRVIILHREVLDHRPVVRLIRVKPRPEPAYPDDSDVSLGRDAYVYRTEQ